MPVFNHPLFRLSANKMFFFLQSFMSLFLIDQDTLTFRDPAPCKYRPGNKLGKKSSLLALVFLFVFALAPQQLFAAPEVPPGSFVSVNSAIVYDLDNDAILFEQNADQRIPPASLTKVLSMFLAMDFMKNGHANDNTPVSISKNAANVAGSRMGLRPGETVPLGKLLKGMAISSGNDASFAVAEHVGGSAEAFVRMMNAKAASLGMLDSHFANPHGLPATEQYTTARDMLTLARAYLKNYPEALELHNTKLLTHAGYTSWNKNPLLGQYPGADGLKSGWIRASGYNLIFTATRNNRRLLAVILGAPDTAARGAEACRLLDAGFMVCGNAAVSVAAALDEIPYDETRIDPRKTGRDAGLLKPRLAQKKLAPARKALTKKEIAKLARMKKNMGKTRKVAAKKLPVSHKRKAHAERKASKARAKRG